MITGTEVALLLGGSVGGFGIHFVLAEVQERTRALQGPNNEELDEAFRDGYEDGLDEGRNENEIDRYCEGFDDGWAAGFDAGVDQVAVDVEIVDDEQEAA